MMKRIIYDYKNPHIVGKARGSVKIGKLVIGIIIAALVIALIYVLFFRKSGYRCEAKEYFVAVAGHYRTEAEAKTVAAELRRRGGGGYIVGESEYTVIVAAYEDRDDAVTVANRYGYDVESMGSYTIWLNEGDASLIKACTLPERIFSTLNEVADELGSGMISTSAASFAVKDAIEEIRGEKEKLVSSGEKSEMASRVEEMMDKLGSAVEAGADINLRYCLIDIAFLYKNFLIYIS